MIHQKTCTLNCISNLLTSFVWKCLAFGKIIWRHFVKMGYNRKKVFYCVKDVYHSVNNVWYTVEKAFHSVKMSSVKKCLILGK